MQLESNKVHVNDIEKLLGYGEILSTLRARGIKCLRIELKLALIGMTKLPPCQAFEAPSC